MSIEDLIQDEKDGPSDASSGEGVLSEFFGVKSQKEKLRNPELCPMCGTSDTEKSHYERRCNNDDCEVVTYIPSSYGVDYRRFMHK